MTTGSLVPMLAVIVTPLGLPRMLIGVGGQLDLAFGIIATSAFFVLGIA